MGSMTWWQAAQDEPAMRCCSSFWRVVRCVAPGASTGNVVLTSGGADGTAWHSRTSRMNLPRRVGEPESACESIARKLAWPRKPARGPDAGSVTLTRSVPVTAGKP